MTPHGGILTKTKDFRELSFTWGRSVLTRGLVGCFRIQEIQERLWENDSVEYPQGVYV